MARLVIPLEATWYQIQSFGFIWQPSAANRPQITGPIAGGETRYFENIVFRRDRSGIVLNIAPDTSTPFGQSGNLRLSSDFESTGSITLQFTDSGGTAREWSVDMSGRDTSEPYRIDFTDGSDEDTAYDALAGTGNPRSGGWLPTSGTIAGTLILDDGQADTTAPTLQTAATNVAGTRIVLTYDEALDEASVPAAGDFTVDVTGGGTKAVSAVAVSGSIVTLTVAAITADETVTLDYTPGTNPIQDEAGNDAAALSGQAVTNNVDTAAPSFASAETNEAGTTVTLTFDEALDTGNVPAASAFTLSPANAISDVAISGSTVVLTTAAFDNGDTITVAYTKPSSNPLQDAAGNEVATFAAQAVTNNVPAAPPPPQALGPLLLDITLPVQFNTGAAGVWTGTGLVPASVLRDQDTAGSINLQATIGATESTVSINVPRFTEELEDGVVGIELADGTRLATFSLAGRWAQTRYFVTAGGDSDVTDAEMTAILGQGRASLVFRIGSGGETEFEWEISEVGSTVGAWTNIGLADDTDDQHVLPELVVPTGAVLDRMRVRDNQFRIEFAGTEGRFTPEVEDNWLLYVEGPPGTVLAVLHDISGAWRAGSNQYRFTNANSFLRGTLAGLNTAIRALGTGATVKLRMGEPIIGPAHGTGVSAPGSAGGRLRTLLPVLARATAVSESGVVNARPGKIIPAVKPARGTGVSAPGSARALGDRIKSFFIGGTGISTAGAAGARANKVPVGPPKALRGTGVSGPGIATGRLRTLLPVSIRATAASVAGAAVGRLRTLLPVLARATGVGQVGAARADARGLAPILDAPRAIQVGESGRTWVAVAWEPPEEDFGVPILGYDYRLDGGPWQPTGSLTTQTRIGNLTIATTYSLELRARNRAGGGAASPPVRIATLQPVVPGVPRAVVVTSPTVSTLRLSWREPIDDGGTPITHYEVSTAEETDRNTVFEATDGPDTDWRVRGLARGHRYGFRVRAVNNIGFGPHTDVVYGTPDFSAAIVVPPGQRIPLIDADRQSLIVRLADIDCRIRVWWQPSDSSWWASLEVPTNTPVIQGRRLTSNIGILDRIDDVLPGNLVLRELAATGAEPRRDAWARPTHGLIWEPHQ